VSADAATIGSDGKASGSVYLAAHNSATPQSGPILGAFVDSKGNMVPTSVGADHLSIYVQKGNSAQGINSVPIPK
jgi:hypothetical protein